MIRWAIATISKSPLTVIAAAVLVLLSAPVAAAAATRYATPSPVAGADCSAAEACSLATALSGASNGETVVVDAGTYGSASAPLGPLSDGGNDLTIEGAVTGAGRPVVYVSQPSITTGGDFTLSGNGSRIQDLDLEAMPEEDGLDLTGDNETAERMRVILAAGGFGDACEVSSFVSNATILDSVCVNHDPGFYSGAGVQGDSSATLRNDTIVGADYGLYVQGTATVINSILEGPAGGDLYNDQSTVSMTDCEFSSLAQSQPTSSTGQVTAAPVFVDAATDNYHTAATSPGVGKGADSPANGSLDLDGDLREIGSATDIGAYEVSPSVAVTTGAASALTTSQATIAGSIDPDSAAVQHQFEYGITTGFGSSTTTVSIPEQAAVENVTANLTGLAPDTTYDYRLVAEIDGIEYDGADRHFTTAIPPPPQNTVAPAIAGTPTAGQLLSCSTGSWTHSPVRYEYQWDRDGTPVQGATGAAYKVGTTDEGTTLTCVVTALGLGGTTSTPATSKGLSVPVPHVPRCPAATGSLSGTSIGLVHLGMTRAQAHHAYSHSSSRGNRYKDFFCLTPHGVRVGYASPKLLKSLSKSDQSKLAGRVVWASTDNVRYAIDGIRAGATLTAAKHQLPRGYYFRVGANYWYLAPAGAATAVLKLRHDLVEEVGIADRPLTGSHKADRQLMTSFS